MYLAALFHPKARKWLKGRQGIFEKLKTALAGKEPVIWMHCASLGEFEQGRPILESLRSQFPQHRLLLTFFSPSGYEIRKNYTGADWVFYLPMDGPGNARRFLEIVQPQLVIFVKYEFWYYYLKKIKYRNIPLLLVSAIFWKKMSFFKWYGAMQRKMLSRFDQLFVQDIVSRDLMVEIGMGTITQISGDSRFDRVFEIARQAIPNAVVNQFARGRKLIVAGSTWPQDEALLKLVMNELSADEFGLVIAPHEIHETHLQAIEATFPGIIRYSALTSQQETHNSGLNPPSDGARRPHNSGLPPFLLIDNIGLLAQLYQHGWVAYIGGGFGKGIHNTLEAAVYGIPLFFGPVYHKFREAKELLELKAAFSIQEAKDILSCMEKWKADAKLYQESADASRDYVSTHLGATAIIMQYIQENRLLTN